MTFTVLYAFLTLATLICSVELRIRRLLHPTFKLFLFSLTLQCTSIVLYSATYVTYATDGVMNSALLNIGCFARTIEEIVYLTLALLLSEGYTIERGRLPTCISIKLMMFVCFYTIIYVAFYVYGTKVYDVARTVYFYESWPAYAILALRLTYFFVFLYALLFDAKTSNAFLLRFAQINTVWFIAPPAIVLITNLMVSDWLREGVVSVAFLSVDFWGHSTFLVLTWPSVANRNFPWRVRRTQVMPRNSYEPDRENTSPRETCSSTKRNDDTSPRRQVARDNSSPHDIAIDFDWSRTKQ